jgi:hypothetical protein
MAIRIVEENLGDDVVCVLHGILHIADSQALQVSLHHSIAVRLEADVVILGSDFARTGLRVTPEEMKAETIVV